MDDELEYVSAEDHESNNDLLSYLPKWLLAPPEIHVKMQEVYEREIQKTHKNVKEKFGQSDDEK